MSQFNPISATLDAQRQAMEAAREGIEKATVTDERMETMQAVDVGQTPSEVVYEENKLELLHYEPLTEEQEEVPILVIYALINRPFILDLQPDRSVIRRLLEAGHDVYMIDWNEPSRLDKHLALSDYINRYIDNCVDEVRERSDQDAINVLGYCMGGTMSAAYAALNPEKLNALALMAAGLCFDNTAGTLEDWGGEDYYDPRAVTETLGNMPGEMLDVGFALMDPIDNYVSKYVRLYDNLENEDFVANFARMETWLSEGIDVAGEAYAEFLEHFYQGNELHENEFHLDGEHVDVRNIDMPVLQVLGKYDHLIPPESSKPFNEVVGSDDTEVIEYPTGHIGLSVSGSSHEDVWPQVCEWFAERSEGSDLEEIRGVGPTYAERLRDSGVATIHELAETDPGLVADVTDARQADAEAWVEAAREELADTRGIDVQEDTEDAAAEVTVETIDGIGPTYADRLREAGIDTPDELAAASIEDVADAADVSETRAEDWIAKARE